MIPGVKRFHISRRSSNRFHDLVFGHELGSGSFSVVKYARHITKGKSRSQWPEFAVKVISTTKIQVKHTQNLQQRAPLAQVVLVGLPVANPAKIGLGLHSKTRQVLGQRTPLFRNSQSLLPPTFGALCMCVCLSCSIGVELREERHERDCVSSHVQPSRHRTTGVGISLERWRVPRARIRLQRGSSQPRQGAWFPFGGLDKVSAWMG